MNSTESMLLPKQYELSFTLETEEVTGDMDKITQAHNVSFEVLDFFINDVMNNSVVVDLASLDVSDEFITEYFENNVVVVPGPGEGTLIACLHKKFNTIIDKLSTVETVSISDKEMRMSQILTLEDEYDSILPSQEEWCGDFPFFKVQWWEDNNTRTYDNYNTDKKEHAAWNRKKKKEDMEALLEAPLTIIRGGIEESFVEEKDGEVIEVEFEVKKKWEPTVV